MKEYPCHIELCVARVLPPRPGDTSVRREPVAQIRIDCAAGADVVALLREAADQEEEWARLRAGG